MVSVAVNPVLLDSYGVPVPDVEVLQGGHVGADAVQALQLVVSQVEGGETPQSVQALQTRDHILTLKKNQRHAQTSGGLAHFLTLLKVARICDGGY